MRIGNRLIILSLLTVFIIGCSAVKSPQELCTKGGGFWNECGSACAGRVVEICTLQCVQQCECGFDEYKCPSGYSCQKEDDAERGVCN